MYLQLLVFQSELLARLVFLLALLVQQARPVHHVTAEARTVQLGQEQGIMQRIGR